MTILVTGATGVVGRQVLEHLLQEGEGLDVQALTRDPGAANLPTGVLPAVGGLGDLDAFRAALAGTSTLFLLIPNVADEVTQAMLAADAAIEAGVRGIVYLSVYRGEQYANVPHFAGKAVVERMLRDADAPATILRPAYFMQNDVRQRDPLTGPGIYAMPVGGRGISMVDTRDIGRAAARELVRRERSATPLPASTIPLVGPDGLTGEALASIWADALGRTVRYGGDDTTAMEQRLKAFAPAWYARDLALMMRRYQTDGAIAEVDEIAATAAALGRAPRSYRAFADETAASWSAA